MYASYLSWMAGETKTIWNNDSAMNSLLDGALVEGAIGLTTNPPLSCEALMAEKEIYSEELRLINNEEGDEYAFKAMSLVVEHFSKKLAKLHKERGTFYGCVRAQVAPNLRFDAKGMLEYGKRLAAIGRNVMVKIPGSFAGMKVLEELAALGIPTNPTVLVSASQAVCAAEAFERGRDRAKKAGLDLPWSSPAIVMGRTQDYLMHLNKERNLGLSLRDLEWAVLAMVKRIYKIFCERGYESVLMPAAFRSPFQVEQLTGGHLIETIHPSIQAALAEADKKGEVRREEFIDSDIDEEAIIRVSSKLPEFEIAYNPEALKAEQFDSFGALTMTLDVFHQGWLGLINLKDIMEESWQKNQKA